MSTYKVQPVYAELVMGWLDLACSGHGAVSMGEVSEVVSWNFKGGELGAYHMQFATDHSGDYYPQGPLADIVSQDGRDMSALLRVIARRRGGRARTMRSVADWAYSYAVARNAVTTSARGVPCMTGLRAVYTVAASVWEDCLGGRLGADWRTCERYIRECALASASASHLDVPTADDVTAACFAAIRSTRAPQLASVLTDVAAIVRVSGSPYTRDRARAQGRLALDGLPGDELITPRMNCGSLAMRVLHGCTVCIVRGAAIALSKSDLVRLHQILSSIMSGLFATAAQCAISPGLERARASDAAKAYSRQVDRIFRAIEAVPQGDEVVVCKAFKRAFTHYLGVLSGPLGAAEAEALWEETLSTPHVPRGLMADWVTECEGWSASMGFNIGKVYKICPAPDACPARTLLERHEMVCNRNTANPAALADLRNVLRDQILRAYVRKPGVHLAFRNPERKPVWADDYMAGRFDMVPAAQIHTYLEWEGTAEMPARLPDDPAVWKDSGLGWDTLRLAMSDEKPRFHGNMMTRMLVDSSAPMPGTRHMCGEHAHKIDTKPEGHKDPARGIYSGNLRDRLDQSWMEAAVEAVARNHPSYMIGADTATREARVRAVVSRCHDHTMQDVYYSFDVKGWSPNMDPAVQRLSHELWATLYNEELFRQAHCINEGTPVYMNKAGYAGWFRNPGANFEGYNGKEMTCVLIALMARAVRKWRERLILTRMCTPREASRWSAVLLAYIDDGLAKLTLPRDRLDQLFAVYKTVTVEAFAECGFTVEVSKCFPSDRFAIFLNEPYLGGRHVVHGTRAAMTICAENTEAHTSLVERVVSVSTGCRGAVASGLDAMCGSLLQAFHVYRHITEWVRRPNAVVAAVWSHMPRNWGGLGMPTALQLGTSGGGSAFEEGVQTMQAWSRVSDTARTAFLGAARSALRPRAAMGMLMSPLGGSLPNGPMVESRVPDAVRAGLINLRKAGRISTLARSFLSYSSPQSMSEFAGRVLSGPPGRAVQEQLLADLASTHPHHLFSAFAKRIEKSSTLISLVGQREMARIIRANRTDAAASYKIAKERCVFSL